MNCPKCLEPVEEGDLFCVCGADLACASEKSETKNGASAAKGDAAKSGSAGGLFKPPGMGAAAKNTGKKKGGLFSVPGAAVPVSRSVEKPVKSTAVKVKGRPYPDCGADSEQVSSDGICTNCGTQVVFSQRDDFTVAASNELAVRSFLGRCHHRNEDYALAADIVLEPSGKTYTVILVSDGVSSSECAHLASEAACTRGMEFLAQALKSGVKADCDLLAEAICAAQEAVLAVKGNGETDKLGRAKVPPEATFLAILLDGEKAYLGWVGDCRAYSVYISATGELEARLLTKDHSWINYMVDSGQLSVEAAEADQQAHCILQVLGPVDSANPLNPSFASYDLTGSQLLLAASDGFWNYGQPSQARPAGPMLEQLKTLSLAEVSAEAIARKLVAFANDTEGRDNITVVVQKRHPSHGRVETSTRTDQLPLN